MPRPTGATCPVCKKVQPAEARICVTCGIDLATGKSILDKSGTAPANLSYAENTRPGQRSRAAKRQIVGEPLRSYWADVALAFIYPVKSGRDILTLAVIFVVAIAAVILRPFGCFMMVGRFIMNGWLASVYLTVVEQTAIAVDELPGIRWEDGPWDDIIKPGLKFFGAFICTLTPAAVYAVLMGTGILPAPFQSIIVLLVWLAGGLFLWPIFVIMFTFDATNKLLRLDLIITTIFRTAKAYFVLWCLLLVVGVCFLLPILQPILESYGIQSSLPSIKDWGFYGAVALQLFGVYLMIVAMRQIGLYYLHFKNRFTFLFE